VGYYTAGGDIGGGTVPSHSPRAGLHALPAAGDVAEAESPGPRGTHRRMNPANMHAFRRALRRVVGMERIARRVFHFTTKHHIKRPRRRRS
jgi:hypothetical protein